MSSGLTVVKKSQWIIGIDEVGRGPLAGPVTVCAVAMSYTAYKKILLKNAWAGVNDSKKMTPVTRKKSYLGAQLLSKRGDIHYVVTSRTAKQIDKKGIAACIRECIAANLRRLNLRNEDCTILLDGSLKAPAEYKKQKTIIRGDSSEKIISLASVIAKVERDHYMIALSKKHPAFSWHQNKGYGTKAHIAAIKKEGLTLFHRKSFLKKTLQTKIYIKGFPENY
jgi:ribonuclease HII